MRQRERVARSFHRGVHGAQSVFAPAPWATAALLLVWSCSKQPTAASEGSAEASGGTASAVVERSPASAGSLPPAAQVVGLSPGNAVRKRHGLAWYEDAPEAAIRAASAAQQLLVVELWAPWCHSCLSMQNFVLSAENLPTFAERFTWLAIDTERIENASFTSQLPVGVWPTFYVVTPELEVHGRWLGAASPAQFARFLSDSQQTFELAQSAKLPPDDARSLVRAADRLATRQEFTEAASKYAQALAAAPMAWPRRADVLVSHISALFKAKAFPQCLEVANRHMGDTGVAASAVDFAYYALECASARAPSDGATALATQKLVQARLDGLCRQGSAELSPDDRADACDKLASVLRALTKTAEARSATEQRLAILEHAAAGKPDEVAAAYDWARTDALLALGRAEDALALASARERALPQNYNPPHYLAKSYKQLGKWPEGLAAIERALALAYGPRRVGLLSLKVELLLGAGRQPEAIAVLRDQLGQYRALPVGQKQPAAEGRVEKRLAELSAGAAQAP
jgi:tetratricopeptide (TPR) repeat protein